MNLLLNKITHKLRSTFSGAYQAEANSLLLAKLHIEKIRTIGKAESLRDVEFRVFSQWGEDGIIQYLINRVPVSNRQFIEFGVGDYRESNTRFLLMNDNWRGLVIDGSQRSVDYIRHGGDFYWKYNLTAVCQFITRENINTIIKAAGFGGDIGLLSIDVDGNDYWIWEAIDTVQPRIVVCEYNSVFGADLPVSVPYDPNFVRGKAHYSFLYFGTSLAALCHLAGKKGYDFVGCCSAGANAFFVRRDLASGLRTLSAGEGFVESQFRESRGRDGKLTYVTGADRLALIAEERVVDVVTGKEVLLKELA